MNETPSGPVRFPPGALRAGVIVFVAATTAGFAALFLITQDLRGSLGGFARFDLRWAVVALALTTFDWLGSGIRIWLLVRPLGCNLRLRRCVRIGTMTSAMAFLTPSSTGAGPTMIYGLARSGVPLGRSVACNFAGAIANLVFLSLAGFTAWVFGAEAALEGVTLPVASISAARLVEWSALGFATVGTTVLLFAAAPRLPRLLLVRTFGQSRRVRRIIRVLQDLHGSLIIYARRGKRHLGLAIVANVVQFGARFMLGWAVLRGFGFDPGFWNVVLLHAMLQFLLYFMPTPGGTGIGEVLAPALMSPFLPDQLLVAYTAVWRFWLTYLTVAVGGTLLFDWLAAEPGRTAGEGSELTSWTEGGVGAPASPIGMGPAAVGRGHDAREEGRK